jgi:hypothetical protein
MGATLDVSSSFVFESIEIRVDALQHGYAVLAGAFGTPTEAEDYLDKLRSAVAWLALEFKVGINPATKRGVISLWEPQSLEGNPNLAFLRDTGWEATDGEYDAWDSQVIPDHKRLIRFEGGRASLLVGLSARNWSEALRSALARPRLADVAADERLVLSVALYSESRTLVIPRTRLLTLMIALEVLLPSTQITEEGKAVLEKLKETATSARDAYTKNDSVWKELDRLLSRVRELGRDSIGSTLRKFVASCAERWPLLGDPIELGQKLSRACGVRSELVHTGATDESAFRDALTFLEVFVPTLLRCLFEERSAAA